MSLKPICDSKKGKKPCNFHLIMILQFSQQKDLCLEQQRIPLNQDSSKYWLQLLLNNFFILPVSGVIIKSPQSVHFIVHFRPHGSIQLYSGTFLLWYGRDGHWPHIVECMCQCTVCVTFDLSHVHIGLAPILNSPLNPLELLHSPKIQKRYHSCSATFYDIQ